MTARLFASPFLGGFECSTHLRHRDRGRLDLIAATGHDRFARQDYERLRSVGILAARDGLRWHLVEPAAGAYDWSTARPLVAAAQATGIQVVWDLAHFGWPDGLDVFSAAFVDRFAAYARAFTRFLVEETGNPTPFLVPFNEPSFLSFAGGKGGFFPPFRRRGAGELKTQFVRAIVAAGHAIREVAPGARLVHTDPIIHIAADPGRRGHRSIAARHHASQFEAWDMIAGRRRPELGGRPELLDVLGVNYYVYNQWIHRGPKLAPGDPQFMPLRHLLRDVHARYGRPLFVAETGIEGEARPAWLRAIMDEVDGAHALGVPVEGVCLYPIVDHPGWEDDRHCPNGLWGYPDAAGRRPIYEPLARELADQLARLRALSASSPVV